MTQDPATAFSAAESTVVVTLLRLGATKPDSMIDWVERHRDRLSGRISREIRWHAQNAMTEQKFMYAYAWYSTVVVVEGALGMKPEAMHASHLANQALFMAADTRDEYEQARQHAIGLMDYWSKAGNREMAFDAARLAADCAYFVKDSAANRREGIGPVLEHLAAAVAIRPESIKPSRLNAFASLVAGTVQAGHGVYWGGDTTAAARLRAIARFTDRWIPLTPDSTRSLNDGIWVQQQLAELGYDYEGDPALASARLDTVLAFSTRTANSHLYTDAALAQYVGTRDRGGSGATLRRLRDSLRERAERIRGEYPSRAGRLKAAERLDIVHGTLLADEIKEQAPRLDKVFRTMELTKARLLLDELHVKRRPFLNPDQARRARALETTFLQFAPSRNLGFVVQELRLVSHLPLAIPFGKDSVFRKQLKELDSLYLDANAGFDTGQGVSALQDVKTQLRPEEALIEYSIPYHPLHPAQHLVVLFLTATSERLFTVPIDSLPTSAGLVGRMRTDDQQPVDFSPLGELVANARIGIQRNDTLVTRHLRLLYHLLIGSLEYGDIDIDAFKRLIIVPHSFLNYVPFEALIGPDRRFLIERVAITRAPSASVWNAMVRRPTKAARRFLAMGNPVLPDSQLPPLDGAAKEVAGIAQMFPRLQVDTLTGVRATESALQAHAPKLDILHFATHGEFPERNALDFHRLLLAASAGSDGSLHAEEIRQLGLIKPRLVVLSVCNGASYRFGPGSEPYGLVSAFVQAGAENVVGTQWPIEDRFGRRMMVSFYSQLAKSDPAEALRSTSMHLIKQGESIRRWASFIVVGPGRPIW